MNKRVFFPTDKLSKKVLGITLGLLFILGIVVSSDANAWWDGKWQQRKKIQFDASNEASNIKENLTDIPMLIRLHTGNFSFSGAKADGSDIRFVSADDKSPLKYHIEKFDPKEEIALVWVKVPRISANSNQDFIWMYYGNSSAPDGQESAGTYDVNHVAVYHLGEKDGNPRDATAYGNHATAFTGKLGVPSIVGNGVSFGGNGEHMTIGESESLAFTKGFTFSVWVRNNQTGKDEHLFSWDDGKQYIIIGLDDTKAYCSLSTGGQKFTTPKTMALTPKIWHHLAVTINPEGRITICLDGKESGSSNFKGTIPAPATDIFIASSANGSNAFEGDMDEIQLSNISRTPEWIKAEFIGQGQDSTLTSVLDEETGGGSSEPLTIHLMKVIIRTITLDGWLIIGFLALMGSGSFVIFMQKIKVINRAKKENKTFTEQFRKIEHPLSLSDKDEDYPNSSLYRVYKAGVDELKILQDRQGEGSFKKGNGISGRAMNGFKAALEKASMMESRRFAVGMIVLNMSVAGGPFLGLLGTVWGVMNTFAGLAEAGEANLTAIAPGVASALACTLAGLLVAIPALFASSYITGHLKDMSADLNVFIDDFILSLEEEKENMP